MPSPVTDELPASSLSAAESYRLMTDLVAPRPIAWVSTCDAEGRGNLAPFSYFQAVCSHPPTIVLGIAWYPDGRMKDTLRNIFETRELVVSHVNEGLVAAAVATSVAYEHGISEWERAGVAAAPSSEVRPARVAEAVSSMECVLRHAIPLGAGPAGTPSSTLVVAEVVHFAIAEGLLHRDPRGRLQPIDPARLGAVGRMGGIAYTTTDSRLEIPRPSVPGEKP